MKKLILILVFFFIVIGSAPLCSQWAKVYGDSWWGVRPNCIHQCRDGGYVMAGAHRNMLFPYYYDSYIIKVNSEGEIEWQYTVEAKAYQQTFAFVQQTIDDGYIIVGRIEGPIVIKLDWQGKLQWAKTFYSGGSYLSYIQEAIDGGYIAEGDGYILRLTYDGEIAWGQKYSFSKISYQSIQQTSEGGYIVAHSESDIMDYFKVKKFSSSLNIEWQKSYRDSEIDLWPKSILQTADGGYFIVGDNDNEVWIVRLNSSGDIIWQKKYTGFIGNRGLSALETNAGGFHVVCSSWDGLFSIMRLAPQGGMKWFRTYNVAKIDYSSLQKTQDGGFITSAEYTVDSHKFVVLKFLSDLEISPQCNLIKEYDVTGSPIYAIAQNISQKYVFQSITSSNLNISLRELDFYESTL